MTGTYPFDWLLFLLLVAAPILAAGCASRGRERAREAGRAKGCASSAPPRPGAEK